MKEILCVLCFAKPTPLLFLELLKRKKKYFGNILVTKARRMGRITKFYIPSITPAMLTKFTVEMGTKFTMRTRVQGGPC